MKSLTSLLLAIYFLSGSLFLPLGDFSLLKDIPGMYRNYSKIATPDELGIIDFIGDYLLHGKEILGNNENDKTQTADNTVQFQHQANQSYCVLPTVFNFITVLLIENPVSQTGYVKHLMAKAYHSECFKPPIR